MALVYFVPLPLYAPIEDKKDDDITVEDLFFTVSGSQMSHAPILTIAVLDVIGNLVLTVGLFYVGSGLYQVLYSSVILFTALLTRVFLNRRMSARQWSAILLITFGLALSSLGSSSHSSSLSPDALETSLKRNPTLTSLGSEDEDNVLKGFFITLMGTFLYAGVYTLNDHGMSIPNHASPRTLCAWIGIYASILVSLLILLTAIPTISNMPLLDLRVIGMYGVLVWSSYAHNLTYFELIKSTGAVATGVLQALRAVFVFGLSHFMFCGMDEHQCFSIGKGVASIVVVFGVLWFSFEKSRS